MIHAENNKVTIDGFPVEIVKDFVCIVRAVKDTLIDRGPSETSAALHEFVDIALDDKVVREDQDGR